MGREAVSHDKVSLATLGPVPLERALTAQAGLNP